MLMFNTGKYVGTLVTLDILCFFMIIVLAVSANKAYKFIPNNDRYLRFFQSRIQSSFGTAGWQTILIWTNDGLASENPAL